MGKFGTFATGSTELHHLAVEGNVEKLKEALDKHVHLINARDVNGWTALHEAIRTGKTDMVELLLNQGAEVDLRTGAQNDGHSGLGLAKFFHGAEHNVTKLLEAHGAKDYLAATEL